MPVEQSARDERPVRDEVLLAWRSGQISLAHERSEERVAGINAAVERGDPMSRRWTLGRNLRFGGAKIHRADSALGDTPHLRHRPDGTQWVESLQVT